MLRQCFPIVLIAGLFACAPGALATTMTVDNTTDVVAYLGTKVTAYYPGPNPYVGGPIGEDFSTGSLSVQTSEIAGGLAVSFDYITNFPGQVTQDGVQAADADIFIRPGNDGYAAAPFTYGISLGAQGANGGLTAGFYAVQGMETSQALWSGRSGFTYGGAYTSTAAYLPGHAGYAAFAAPTVITAGQLLSAASVSTRALGGGLYDVDASLVLNGAEADILEGGFDVFWGTADCGNGSFLAEFPKFSVMEPASFLLLVTASSLVMLMRRAR
jgi:hypothetical protein